MGINVFPQSSGMDLSIYHKDNVSIVYNTVLTANVLTTVLSVTGKKGFLSCVSGYLNSAMTDFELKITVDGVVEYHAGVTLATPGAAASYSVATRDFITTSGNNIMVPTGGNVGRYKVLSATDSEFNISNSVVGDKISTTSLNFHGLILNSPIFFNSSLLIECRTNNSSKKYDSVVIYKTLS